MRAKMSAVLLSVAGACATPSTPTATTTSNTAASHTPTEAPGADDDAARALDAVGALSRQTFDPSTIIAAVNALQPMGRVAGTAFLTKYLTDQRSDPRDGLFAVIRILYAPTTGGGSPFACTDAQRAVVDGACLRPPALGAPSPSPPATLRAPLFPILVVGDVPLSLVDSYLVGGLPESISTHLAALIDATSGWLATPLAPLSAEEVLEKFEQSGAATVDNRDLIAAQVARLGG